MSEHCGTVWVYEGSSSGVAANHGFQMRLRESPGCVTFPLFTGGFRGSFRSSVVFLRPPAQRFSSTAVYPPCPWTLNVNSDAGAAGHDGYTASSWAIRVA